MSGWDIIGGSYTARSKAFDSQRTVNLYPEASGSGTSKTIAMLVGAPGTKVFSTLAGGGIRGGIRFSATQAIAVAGGNVYSVTPAGVGTLIGTIINRASLVSMASNGIVVMLVTGPEGYIVDPVAATVTQIVNPAFTGADRVDYIDGTFVFNKPGTARFQITGLLTPAIDPLDFASAEGAPDLLISLIVDHEEIWLFGETSTEVFFDSGNPDFPYERIQGAFIEQGCAAKNSPCKMASQVYWLGADDRGQGVAYRNTGYREQRISTHAEEFAWRQYSRIDDAFGYTYQAEGHSFWVLTFPTANATWVYDANTELWCERAWRNPADGSLNRHRSSCHIAFAGKNIVGDWERGLLYELDLNTYTDNGDILPAFRQCAVIVPSGDNVWMFFHRLWLDIETGVGLITGQGSDPQIMLEWSDDGGVTFPNFLMVSVGKVGERGVRANFRRLGKSRRRVFRITMTDPVKRAWFGGDLAYTEGNA